MNLVEGTASKVPEVTLVFWIIKIAATTLGETGGDTVTMTLNWGYLLGTALFLSLLVIFVILRIAAKKFHPYLYWATIVASTTAGTTMADFADRSLGVGYAGGSSLLFVCLIVTLAVWYWTQGSISVATVNTPKVEAFYWIAITFSQTLGTALGDWTADDTGLGYDGGAMVFAAGLAVLAALYFWTGLSRVFLFWAAFILTRPLGATVGDFLDKPRSDGGMALSRPIASAVIAVFIIACLLVLPHSGRVSIRDKPRRHDACWRVRLSWMRHQNTATMAITTPATSTSSSAEFSIQAIAGMPSAMIRPSRQTCQDSTCTPAVKVPSASKVKIASPVALALKSRCTLASSIMFMTTMKAIQCSA
jgi:uncharacterized membrane-anchored protein